MIFSESCRETRRALRSMRAPGRSEVRYRAVSIGSAAHAELSAPGVQLRVHSVFASALNLEAVGTGRHVVLTGPAGRLYPSAVSLDSPVDFRAWRLLPGSHAWLVEGSICMQSQQFVVLDLNDARRRLSRALPTIDAFTKVCSACARRLAAIQARQRHELTIDALLRGGPPLSPLAAVLRQRTLALSAATRAFARSPEPRTATPRRCGNGAQRRAIEECVSGLVGLGPGLTPSGDDFLSGFVAAIRARRLEGTRGGALQKAICAAVKKNLGWTSDVSAALLRCMLLDHWPDPLLDLAEAIAADREPDALQALEDLCRLGHSSGADIATGFLFGLKAVPRRGIETRDSRRSVRAPSTARALFRDHGSQGGKPR